jgi:hypothetical protein
MSGVEDYLLQEGYFYFVASHRHRPDLIDEYPRLFLERSIDGLIAVDTPWSQSLSVPVVTVSGHNDVKGVTNIVLNHQRGAVGEHSASSPAIAPFSLSEIDCAIGGGFSFTSRRLYRDQEAAGFTSVLHGSLRV